MPANPHHGKVLLVDDDPGLLRLLTIRLKSEGYEVAACESAAQALASTPRFHPDVVVTDLRMAQTDGIGLLKELQRRYPALPVILMTAHGTIPDAVEATRAGAFAFLTKPVEREQLLAQLSRAMKMSGSARAADEWHEGIVTRCAVMEERLAQALRVAGTDAPVLLTGPRGTGKSVLAAAIHRASARRQQRFVQLDCALVAAEGGLAEALAGRGSASDDEPTTAAAAPDTEGAGTLYLSAIDELVAPLQAQLAEHLDAPTDATPARPRLIASSHRDLGHLASSGAFRSDLYYRFAALQIAMPTLAQRREDLPLLAAAQLDRLAEVTGRRLVLAPDAQEILVSTDWPGNLPQLYATLAQLHATTTGAVISAEMVQRALGSAEARVPAFDEARDEFTRSYLTQLLQLTRGNVSQAARLARRNRTDFYKLLAKHDVKPELFKAG